MQIPRYLPFALIALLAIVLWKFAPQKKKPTFSTKEQVTQHKVKEQPTSEGKSELAQKSPKSVEQRLKLLAPDLTPILADALDRDQKKLPFRFATPLEVGKTSSELAPWTIKDGVASWELEVHAPQALSLNFAFDQFHMPPGGSLSLQSADSNKVITFTSQDNDEHGELWTPIFRGNSVRLTASLPSVLLPDLRLSLAKVNYGFRDKKNNGKIGGDSSGSCNVDVVCDASNVEFGGLIDNYREQIRSVAAYTLNGIDTCTGALINNTLQDNKPYFLTAAHCQITLANDSSIVLYWNFENSTCRPPGSPDSGGVGDGDLTIFNSGSILRAVSANSDFCLIELDDPVNQDSQAYFAGWNRSSTSPSEAVGIHHPAVAEKRISFEFDPLSTTNYSSTTTTTTGTHLRVVDWDHGTTEGGSSGSPLFNAAGQIVGQLEGGSAACGNNASDWYGRFFTSWTGGGTSGTRLSDWLAPSGTAPISLAGRELTPQIQANDIAITEGNSGTQTATITIALSSEADTPVTFTLTATGGTASAGSDYINPNAQTLTITPPQTSTTLNVIVNGDSLPEENETILFTFSNVTGAQTPSLPITVVITNDDFIPPIITSSLSENGNEGSFFGYQIEASNTPTSYSLSGQPTGMSIDPTSGLIAWNSPLVGSYNFTISATNQSGTASETFALTIAESLLKSAFEIPSAITIGGDVSQWAITTTDTFDGEDALTLSTASDSSDTLLSCTVVGPDELTFWWKASTEYIFDAFSLTLDSTPVTSISGETGWHSHTLSIPPGTHTVGFQYLRDASADGGFNQVWLDRFTLKSLSNPAFIQPTNLFIEQNIEASIQLSTTFDSSSIETTPLPQGWDILPDNHLSGTTSNSFSFTATATNDQGTSARDFSLTPFNSPSVMQTALDLSELSIRSESPAFFSQTNIRTTGTNAARSGFLGGEGRSEMTISLIGPGTLRFQWQVSSEENYDFGYVLQNGKQIAVETGLSGWLEVALPLTLGLNEITWLYVKDETVSQNLDALFVDNVRLEGYAKWVFDNGMSPYSLPPGSGIDGDANPGLIEYAVGLSPVTSEAPHLLDLTGSTGNRTLSTSLNASAVDLTISIEKSTTLTPNSWNTIGTTSAPLGTILSTSDTSGDIKAFYRLHATSP